MLFFLEIKVLKAFRSVYFLNLNLTLVLAVVLVLEPACLIHLHVLSLTKISLKILGTSVNEEFVNVYPRFCTDKVLQEYRVVAYHSITVTFLDINYFTIAERFLFRQLVDSYCL